MQSVCLFSKNLSIGSVLVMLYVSMLLSDNDSDSSVSLIKFLRFHCILIIY